MRNPIVVVILLMLSVISSSLLLLFPEERQVCERKQNATAPVPQKQSYDGLLAKKTNSVPRLETLGLFPEEGHFVRMPTKAYLEKLEEICRRDWIESYRYIWGWRLEEVRKGCRDLESRVDPVYGRPTFNENQLRYIRWSEKRILELLQHFEHDFILVERM